MNVVILAREGSRRYPGKHLHPIGGKPMLTGIIEQILKNDGRPILCTGAHDNNRNIVQCALDAGADWYCEEIYPEWDLVSRMLGMSDELGVQYWIAVSGDCPFSDFSLMPELWARIVKGDVDTATAQSTYSTVIGDRAISAVNVQWYAKMDAYFDQYDREREQPWVHYPDTKTAHVGTTDRTTTPIKTSIDWPLEGAIADLVVRHLGRWPETDEDVERAYREILKLETVVDSDESFSEEDA